MSLFDSDEMTFGPMGRARCGICMRRSVMWLTPRLMEFTEDELRMISPVWGELHLSRIQSCEPVADRHTRRGDTTLNPFDFLNSINHKKDDIMVDDEAEKGYSPFMVTGVVSYHQDTVLLANEMNMNSHLDHRLQYDFLRTAIPTPQEIQ